MKEYKIGKHVLKLEESDPRNEYVEEFMKDLGLETLMGEGKGKLTKEHTFLPEKVIGKMNRNNDGAVKDIQKAFDYWCKYHMKDKQVEHQAEQEREGSEEYRQVNITINLGGGFYANGGKKGKR